MRFYIIPNLNQLDKCIQLSKKYNFGFEYNEFFNPCLLDDKQKLNEVINTYKQLNRSNDYMHGVFLDICLNSYDQLIKEVSEKRVLQSLEIAKQLNLKGVTFHTNYINWMTNINSYCDKWINDNAMFYKKVAKLYPDINIYIENMFDDSPYLLKKLIEEINLDNVKVCLDFAHAFISKTNINEWVNELKPYIGHIHINDNNGQEDSHLKLGEGNINYKQLFNIIKDLDVSVLIEMNNIDNAFQSYLYLVGNDKDE